MPNRFFRTIGHLFEGAGRVAGTPSGEARRHNSVYAHKTVTRGRNV